MGPHKVGGQNMNKDKFYLDGIYNGYYCIRNRSDKDDYIWIDCHKEYIDIILMGLNKGYICKIKTKHD